MKHFVNYLLVALFTLSFTFSAEAFELRYNEVDATRTEQSLDASFQTAKKGKKLGWKKRMALKIAKKKLKKAAKKSADSPQKAKAGKSWVVAILLSFFLGMLGIHRFYLGYTVIGIIQLLTFGGLGIWAFVDFIRIIVKDLQPKDGEYTD